MHPSLDAMIITPICPHTLKARSTVISGDAEIKLRVTPRRKDTHIAVLADGRLLHTLEADDVIRIRRSDKKIRLIKLNGRNFFDILREKLSDR